MTMIIQGLGGSYTPDRRPNSRRRRTVPGAEDTGAGPPVQPGASMHDSWLSEQSRAEIAAVAQAIQAAETAREIVEMAGRGLSGIKTWLAAMRAEIEQASQIPKAEEPAPERIAAHQEEMARAREEIAELVNSVLFGRMRLLDGGLGCTGMAFGEGLDFVRASPQSRASSPEGYPVWIEQEATRASVLAPVKFAAGQAGNPPVLAIEENGLRAEFTPQPGQQLGAVAAGLRRAVASAGLRVVVDEGPCEQLLVRHIKYGSAYGFALSSSIPGVFSQTVGQTQRIANGRDVAGSINGEPALGEGQILTGCGGNRTTDGLAVRFSGKLPVSGSNGLVMESLHRLGMGLKPEEMADLHLMGRVILVQQPYIIRLGAAEDQAISIRLDSMHPRRLGQGVENSRGFRSLAEIQLGDAAHNRSALMVLERAEEDVRHASLHLEELRGSVLAESLSRLRGEAEKQRRIFTNIADGQRARQVAQNLRNHMQSRGPAALLAQMQPLPGAMVRLLTDEAAQA